MHTLQNLMLAYHVSSFLNFEFTLFPPVALATWFFELSFSIYIYYQLTDVFAIHVIIERDTGPAISQRRPEL